MVGFVATVLKDSALCGILGPSQELVLFNRRGHTRCITCFQFASMDASLAAYSRGRAQSNLRGQSHLDFNSGALRDSLGQKEVHSA